MKNKPLEETPEVSTEFSPSPLVENIAKVSAAVESLLASGLNQHAVVVLLADATKLPKRTIREVLEALKTMKDAYTTSCQKN